MRRLAQLWRDARGATSIEYAVIAGLISLAIITGATQIGTKLSARFTQVSANLT